MRTTKRTKKKTTKRSHVALQHEDHNALLLRKSLSCGFTFLKKKILP